MRSLVRLPDPRAARPRRRRLGAVLVAQRTIDPAPRPRWRGAPRRGPVRCRCRPGRTASGPAPAPAARRPSTSARIDGGRAVVVLGERDLRVGEGRHLRQVGDHEHLLRLGQRRQRPADRPRGRAADAGVDLVEHERGHPGPDDEPQGQHRAGQLATRRRLGERGGGQAGVQAEQERHVVAGVDVAHLEAAPAPWPAPARPGAPAPRSASGRRRGRAAARRRPRRPRPPRPSACSRAASAAAARSAWLSSSASRADSSSRTAKRSASGRPAVADVATPQVGQLRPPLLHRGEPLGIALDALGQRSQVPRRRRPARPRPIAGARRSAANGDAVRRAPPAPPRARSRAPRSVLSAASAAAAAASVGVGVGEDRLLGEEPIVLALVGEARRLDLVELVAEEVALAVARGGVAAQRLELVLGRRAAPRAPPRARWRSTPAKRSRARRWLGGGEQADVGVLGVQVDEAAGQLGELAGGDEAPVAIGAGPAGARHHPGEDELVVVHHEPALHGGLLGPGAHDRRVGSVARPAARWRRPAWSCPAPVSPVRAVIPGSSRSVTPSITPRSLTDSSASTLRIVRGAARRSRTAIDWLAGGSRRGVPLPRRGGRDLAHRRPARLVVAGGWDTANGSAWRCWSGWSIRIALAVSDDVITNDASAYLRSGESLWAGDGFRREGHPELHFPPLYPAVLGGLHRLLRRPARGRWSIATLRGQHRRCSLLVASLARRLGGDRAAVAAVWVAALAPGLTDVPVTSGSGNEVVFVLLVLAAIRLALLAHDRARRRRATSRRSASGAHGRRARTSPDPRGCSTRRWRCRSSSHRSSSARPRTAAAGCSRSAWVGARAAGLRGPVRVLPALEHRELGAHRQDERRVDRGLAGRGRPRPARRATR